MEEMNIQLQQKFQSIIELRLQQVSGVILTNPPEESQYGEALLQDLQKRAEVRDFAYLGFYTEQGDLIDIYGSKLQLEDHYKIQTSLMDWVIRVINTVTPVNTRIQTAITTIRLFLKNPTIFLSFICSSYLLAALFYFFTPFPSRLAILSLCSMICLSFSSMILSSSPTRYAAFN